MQGISLQGQVLTNVLHSQMKPMIDLGPDLEKPPEARYKKVTWSQVQKSHLKPGRKFASKLFASIVSSATPVCRLSSAPFC